MYCMGLAQARVFLCRIDRRALDLCEDSSQLMVVTGLGKEDWNDSRDCRPF